MKEKDDNDQIFQNDPIKDNLLEIENDGKTTMKKPGCCIAVFNIIFPCFLKVDTKTSRLVLFLNSTDNATY